MSGQRPEAFCLMPWWYFCVSLLCPLLALICFYHFLLSVVSKGICCCVSALPTSITESVILLYSGWQKCRQILSRAWNKETMHLTATGGKGQTWLAPNVRTFLLQQMVWGPFWLSRQLLCLLEAEVWTESHFKLQTYSSSLLHGRCWRFRYFGSKSATLAGLFHCMIAFQVL